MCVPHHIVERATPAEGNLLVPVHGQTKVTQAHATTARQEDVLRLDIPAQKVEEEEAELGS